MSTRCSIIVKLEKKDLGKDFLVNHANDKPSIFHTYIDKPYISIYIHHDGYLSGVGQDIIDNLDSYEKALKFVLQGDMTEFDYPYTEYRNESYENNKPNAYDKLDECPMQEYNYLFDNGEWKYMEEGESQWKDLST